ncbi:MAG: aspartate aminotransferase family protein [Clostridiaceae bacterium]
MKNNFNLEKQSVLFTTKRNEVVMSYGKGMYIYDTEGKQYLDFIGGWAVNCLGHSPLVIEKTLSMQGKELINCSPSFYNIPMLKFAKLLTDNSCFDKVFFINSGAEANEGAIKLARKYGEKEKNGAYEIITTINGFHGRTLATMSATGKSIWKDIYEPKVKGFIYVPFNDIEAIKDVISERTCAVMLEPIQGEGGVNVASNQYIKELRRLCDENNILLIFDEVQTGIGRCGEMFAYQIYNVEPDIITLGKGIAGGYPLAAMMTKSKYDIFEAGDQGGTYSAQPLGMAVGHAVVNEIIEKNICENVKKNEVYLKEKINSIAAKFNLTNIRGKGMLQAFDLPSDDGSKLVEECFKEGLIINSPKPNVIRLIPPLIVCKDDIDEMVEIITKVLDKIYN